jgi:ComF family protein
MPPLCDRCGDPLPTWRMSTEYGTCEHCRRSPSPVVRTRAIGPYDGVLRGIVHALKYDGRRSLARPLGALMREHGADVLAGADALVPVPLHPSRRRTRGFNQADDLARAVGAPVVHALRRVRATADQVQLPVFDRQTNVQSAFAMTARGARLEGAIVVLVDDVSTTGATLDACARTLREAGVSEVRGLTAARALRRDGRHGRRPEISGGPARRGPRR